MKKKKKKKRTEFHYSNSIKIALKSVYIGKVRPLLIFSADGVVSVSDNQIVKVR